MEKIILYSDFLLEVGQSAMQAKKSQLLELVETNRKNFVGSKFGTHNADRAFNMMFNIVSGMNSDNIKKMRKALNVLAKEYSSNIEPLVIAASAKMEDFRPDSNVLEGNLEAIKSLGGIYSELSDNSKDMDALRLAYLFDKYSRMAKSVPYNTAPGKEYIIARMPLLVRTRPALQSVNLDLIPGYYEKIGGGFTVLEDQIVVGFHKYMDNDRLLIMLKEIVRQYFVKKKEKYVIMQPIKTKFQIGDGQLNFVWLTHNSFHEVHNHSPVEILYVGFPFDKKSATKQIDDLVSQRVRDLSRNDNILSRYKDDPGQIRILARSQIEREQEQKNQESSRDKKRQLREKFQLSLNENKEYINLKKSVEKREILISKMRIKKLGLENMVKMQDAARFRSDRNLKETKSLDSIEIAKLAAIRQAAYVAYSKTTNKLDMLSKRIKQLQAKNKKSNKKIEELSLKKLKEFKGG